MITVTPAAAAQIRKAAEESDAQGMCLRIAVRTDPDGSFAYGMGFDTKADDDVLIASEGVDLLISPGSKEFLQGAILDFVELNPGEHNFIFINPNDPSHSKAPERSG